MEVSAATDLALPGDPIQLVSEVVGTTKLRGAAAEGTGIPDGRLAEYRSVDPIDGRPLAPGEAAPRPGPGHGPCEGIRVLGAQPDVNGCLQSQNAHTKCPFVYSH